MTWFDIAFIVVVAISIGWGIWRGLVHEMLSLGGWVLAFLAANLFSGPLSESITSTMAPELRVLLAWLGVFVVVLLAASLVGDRKSTRLNSSHLGISYAVFCLKKKKTK